jgi:hypothetical protein
MDINIQLNILRREGRFNGCDILKLFLTMLVFLD